jgi:hypothetical protein
MVDFGIILAATEEEEEKAAAPWHNHTTHKSSSHTLIQRDHSGPWLHNWRRRRREWKWLVVIFVSFFWQMEKRRWRRRISLSLLTDGWITNVADVATLVSPSPSIQHKKIQNGGCVRMKEVGSLLDCREPRGGVSMMMFCEIGRTPNSPTSHRGDLCDEAQPSEIYFENLKQNPHSEIRAVADIRDTRSIYHYVHLYHTFYFPYQWDNCPSMTLVWIMIYIKYSTCSSELASKKFKMGPIAWSANGSASLNNKRGKDLLHENHLHTELVGRIMSCAGVGPAMGYKPKNWRLAEAPVDGRLVS